MFTFEQPWEKLVDPRDALAKLLIEKGLITQAEFMQKLSAERAVRVGATCSDPVRVEN